MSVTRSVGTLPLGQLVLFLTILVLTLCGIRIAGAFPNEVWASGGEYRWKINDVEKGSSTDLNTAINRCLWDSGGIGREIHVLTGGDLSNTMTLPSDVKLFFHGNTFNITHDGYGVHGKGDHNVEMHDATFVSGPYYVFRMSGCNNFLASGINIDGGGIGMRIESSDSNHPWDFTAYDLTVKNCRFENLSSHGLETFGIDRFHVDGIVARNNGECGVLFNASRNGYVGTVDAYRCCNGGGYAGLRFANGNSNILVRYLRAIECGRGFFTTTGASNIIVEEVHIRDSSSHNILLQDSDGVGINSGSFNGGALYHYTSGNCWITAQNVTGVTISPPATPATPTVATGTSGDSLTWSAVSGATNYYLLRATTSGGPFRTIAFTEATSFIDREVVAGTTYYYVLKANNAAGPGGTSGEVSATPTATPTIAVTTGLQLHYPFNNSAAENGGGTAATIAGTATYVPGLMNQALGFDGSTNYATLPGLTSSSYREFTAAGWVWASSAADWQRVFDFGNGTTDYVMVSRASYGGIQFVIRRNGSDNWIKISHPPLDRWFHLAVTFAGNWATIHINGEARKTVLCSHNPTHLTLANNYLGKSQFTSDPLFKGRMDDFRLYNRSLSKAEVRQLVMNAPALPPYDLIASAFGNKANLSWTGTVNAATYKVKRATTSGGPYTTVATDITGTTYSDTTVVPGTKYYYVVSAVNPNGESLNSSEDVAVVSDLAVHLKFDETLGTVATDFTGNGSNATLVNGAGFVSGVSGNALSLPDNAGQYATLPTGVVSGFEDFTISAWVRVSAFETWSRIFDFGTGTDNYMFLTTQYDASTANARKLQFGIRTPSTAAQLINSSTAISAADTWAHVAVTLSGTTGRMYLNGSLIGTNGNMTLRPSSLGYTTRNYLGKSQFNDPIVNATIDDFRIYSRALTDSQLSALAAPVGGASAAWSNSDIGTVGAGGFASHADGVYTVAGSGGDIWGSADEFQFIHQQISGDCDIRARVASVQNTNNWAKAGVMIRETLNANSTHAMTIVTPAQGVSFQRRKTTGGGSSETTTTGLTAPYWVRLVRAGDLFTSYRSSDGVTWTSIGSETIAMNTDVYMGLAVTSHADGTLCTATFDNVSFAAVPSPWQSADIGAVAVAGSTTRRNGVFTVDGSGADIWGVADEFRYVYQTASGDCAFVARVSSVENTNNWARAGVMIRETLNADSPHAVAVVTPGAGASFLRRKTTGGTTSETAVTGVAAPYWVRVVRSGDGFTASRSSDGSSWTNIGSETIAMSANVYIGLAVSSHNDGTLCTATFDNASVTP